MRPSHLCLAALALLPGCATILDGTTQHITLQTAPNGAACTVRRGGEHLGTVAPTPGTLLVERGRRDLTVVCLKPGWEPTVANIEAKFTAVTLGNVIIGGLGGVIVDAATGANYRYDEGKIIPMTPPQPSRMPTGNNMAPTPPIVPFVTLPPPTGVTAPRATDFGLSQAGRV